MVNMDILERWKSSWVYPTSLLCFCGFFSSVKPLEPFLIPYLTGPDKNLTIEQDFPEAKRKDSQKIQAKGLKSSGAESSPDTHTIAPSKGCCGILLQLWSDFLQCYSTQKILYWSAWWAMATCGYNQTVNYIQALWEHIEPSSNFTVYNGGVEAVSSLFGAAAAYGIGFTPTDWSRWGEMALGSLSGLGGGALYIMVFTANIWVCYAGYIIFKSLYMLLITITMFQIAAGLSTERYALVFGTNTFVALIFQTILTSVVVDSTGFGLDIVPQFIIYGTYFFFIALIFFLRGLYSILYLQCAKKGKLTDDVPQGTNIIKPDTYTCGEAK
ncbi:thiamine transporter 1 isoform X2 [Brachyhypopomus gauderio]|uniref:thiamine transporter 1 isoform X2 n=1 Tax=Brachyhypopomus gauderio TaxID=698409 RepID=UPI004042E820